jgi:hypothetical protein
MADGNPSIAVERSRELLTSAAPYDASLLGYEEGPTREDHTEPVFYPHRYGSSYRLSHEGYSVELPELIAERFAKEILEDVARRKALKGRAA